MMEQAKAQAEAARLRRAEEDMAEAQGAAVAGPSTVTTTLKLEEGEADELFDDDDDDDDEEEMLEELGEGIKAAGLGG